MDPIRRRIVLALGAAVIATPLLAAGLDAAGDGIALGVAIAALAALVLSYVRFSIVAMRAFGDEDATERVRRAGRIHIPVVFAAPLVVTAAWAWGPASVAVGFGALMLCQILFMHFFLIIGVAMRRRGGRGGQPARAVE